MIVVNEDVVKYVFCCQLYSDILDHHERSSLGVCPYIRGIVLD
jgi:hypothetical protein